MGFVVCLCYLAQFVIGIVFEDDDDVVVVVVHLASCPTVIMCVSAYFIQYGLCCIAFRIRAVDVINFVNGTN